VVLFVVIGVPVAYFIMRPIERAQPKQPTNVIRPAPVPVTPSVSPPPPTTVSLDEARRTIPGIVMPVYEALDQGNPQALANVVSAPLLKDLKKLDYICQPFTHRAHYVEAVVERVPEQFEARVRVLYKPMTEAFYVLYFRQNGGQLYLADVSQPGDPEEMKYFATDQETAAEMARKFLYAAKAGRADVISQLVTKELDVFTPELRKMRRECYQSTFNFEAEKPVTIRHVDLVGDRGLKIRVQGKFGEGAETWDFRLDKMDDEYKIVAWGCSGTYGTEHHREDPNLEAYTLKRFNLSGPGTGK
jgi:hypothetical protein